MYADGVKIDERNITQDDGWVTSFDNLYAHNTSDGHVIDYKVVRENASGIPSNYDVVDIEQPADNATGLIVRAVHIATTSIPITKIWDDMDNIYNERPNSIEIVLYKNNEIFDRLIMSPSGNNGENEWTDSFSQVPLWDENEQWIDWTIEESPVYGYDYMGTIANGDDIGAGFTITNQIWKHVEMPETGKNDLIQIWGLAIVLISLGLVSIGFRIRRDAARDS